MKSQIADIQEPAPRGLIPFRAVLSAPLSRTLSLKRMVFVISPALILCSVCWELQLAAQQQTAVVGLTVCRAAEDSDFGGSLVPGLQAGTQVYLRIGAEKNAILRVAETDSPTVKLSDSAGKELEIDESFNFAFFSQVSEDKKSIIVPLLSKSLPSAGADSLTIKGNIEIVIASDLKTETVDVKLESGEKIKLGGVEAVIKSVEAGFSGDSQSIELESKSAFDQLESLAFIGADGQEITSSSMGGGSFGFGDSVIYSKSMQIEGTAANVKKIRVKFFAKTESAKIELNSKVDLSLGGR